MATDFAKLQELEAAIRANRAGRWNAETAAGLHSKMNSNAARQGYYEGVDAAAIRAGLKCYQCVSAECMAIFFSREPEASCRACEAKGLQYAVVAGTVTGSPCNSICTNATDAKCDCSCGGANHGDKWLRGFTFPRNIEAHRRELRERRESRQAIAGTYDTEAFAQQVEEAQRLRDFFQSALDDAIEADFERADAFVAALLAGPAPEVLLTKARKRAASQLFEFRVVRARCALREPYHASAWSDSRQPVVELTGERADGSRVWCRLHPYEFTYRGCTSENYAHRCDVECYESEITAGDFVQVKARVKEATEDGMTFLQAASVTIQANPFGWVLGDAPEGQHRREGGEAKAA